MRRTPFIVVGGVLVVGLTVAATDSNPAAPAATATVNVHVHCQNNRVSFWVDPWTVSINQGDDVEWRLQGNSTSNSISVSPKRGQWPFNGNPQAGTKANPARSGGPANRLGRHGYNITLQCDGGATVVIDPDIEIDG